ncbi:MAG: hypothetical protein KAH96_03810 [Alphaproteobacteria bacterium]|nr:hypothetical protein [Alphaproteobacteria bacterium]
MNKFIALSLIVILAGCSSPSVITGNSRSVTINDGQYTKLTDATVETKALADEWCAKHGRVSGPQKPPFGVRHKTFECLDK